MRHGAAGRRSRNRGHGNRNRGGGQHHGNRGQVYDSNGPDVRIRGTAYQILEKYQTLARDASALGDRILAESYLQHAEHYQRIVNSYGPPAHEQQRNFGQQQQQPGADQPQTVVAHAVAPSVGGDDLALPHSILGQARATATQDEEELADA